MEIADREILVTGASSGIGAAIARELAGRGARVTLVARSREGLERVAAELEAAGGSARVEPADLSQLDDVEALASRVLSGTGAPDVLINNAGAGRWRAIDETDPGEATQMMALPYLAAFELTRALTPAMIAKGRGRVVCMTSLAGYTYVPGATGYAVARWAMRAFASQLRADLRGTGVGVTLIAPSEVDSPYFDNNPGSRERIPRAVALLGAAVAPEVVAQATAAAIERDRQEVIVPRRAEIVTKLTPRPILDLLVTDRTGRRGERPLDVSHRFEGPTGRVVVAKGTAPLAGLWRMTIYESRGSVTDEGDLYEPEGLPGIELSLPDPPEGRPQRGGGSGLIRNAPGFSRGQATLRAGQGTVKDKVLGIVLYGRAPERANYVRIAAAGGIRLHVKTRRGPPGVPGRFWFVATSRTLTNGHMRWVDTRSGEEGPAVAVLPP